MGITPGFVSTLEHTHGTGLTKCHFFLGTKSFFLFHHKKLWMLLLC